MKKTFGFIVTGFLALTAGGVLTFTNLNEKAPLEAKATETGQFRFADIDLFETLTPSNKVIINGSSYGGDGTLTLEIKNDNFVLTLDNFSMEHAGSPQPSSGQGNNYLINARDLRRDVYINLIGTNTFSITDVPSTQDKNPINISLNNNWDKKIYLQTDPTADARATLNLKTTDGSDPQWNSTGIRFDGETHISNCTINTILSAPYGSIGISFNRIGYLDDGAIINATGGDIYGNGSAYNNGYSYGIRTGETYGGLVINEGAVVNATGGDVTGDATGIITAGIYGGNITQNDGTVTALGGTAANSGGQSIGTYLYNNKNITINGGSFNSRGFTSWSVLSYGMKCNNGSSIVTTNGNARFEALGYTKAIECYFKNGRTAEGWLSDPTSTDPGVLFPAPGAAAKLDYRRIASFPIDYTADYSAVGYDTEEHTSVTLDIVDPLPSACIIGYKLTGESQYKDEAPKFTNVGNYSVDYKIEAPGFTTEICTVIFTISPAEMTDVSVTPNVNSFVYDGSAKQPTVTTHAETVDGSTPTFTYSYEEEGTYTSTIPTKTDVGNYTVYWKVNATNHNEQTGSFNYSITKATSFFTTEPSGKTLAYTGNEQELLNEGVTPCGTVQYKLGDEGEWGNDIPSATNVGEYTVYYMIEGDANHNDSEVKNVKAHIVENNKTALAASIAKAETLYNNIKEAYPEVAETLKGATDAAKVVNSNTNVTIKQIEDAVTALNAAIDKAIADTRDVVVDENSGVSVKTSDGTAIPTNINLKVEVRSDVKANEETAKDPNVKQFVKSNEYISYIYDIKLIKTEDGVETEIQPSEIEEGLKIIVTISLPEGVDGSAIRLLHIHSSTDIEIVENFASENGQISFEINKLSQIALLSKSRASAGLPAWAIVLIVIGSLILVAGICYLVFFFLLNKWIKKDDKALRVFRLGKEYGEYILLTMFFRIEYRKENEVFDSKEEALK